MIDDIDAATATETDAAVQPEKKPDEALSPLLDRETPLDANWRLLADVALDVLAGPGCEDE